MPTAHFAFMPDLPFFLSPAWVGGEKDYAFDSGQSLKHLIEAAGVPHTEVGEVQVNAAAAHLSFQLQDGDRVVVWSSSAQRGPQPDSLCFVLDNHLGRLAAYLRMMGFDALYRNDYQDEELARIAVQEQRILLTRDRRLLMRRVVIYGYCLRSLNSQQQLLEVARRYHLYGLMAPFQRCLRCNGKLQLASKDSVYDRLQPLTRLYYDEFHLCPECGQVYWKGSHYDHMRDLLLNLQGGAES